MPSVQGGDDLNLLSSRSKTFMAAYPVHVAGEGRA